MNVWANTVVTDKGYSLLAKLTQGNTLDLVEAVTGSGYITPGLLTKQTEVTEPKQTLAFRPVSYPETGKCALPVSLTNEGLTTGYEAMQLGVFANDPDEGKILFFIAQCASTEKGPKGTMVPSETEMPGYSADWIFYLKYGQADGVSVTVDPSNTVSREEMEKFIELSIIPISQAEIAALIGMAGSGGNGDTGSVEGSGVATLDHSLLYNRNTADQHTIASITGLEDALSEAEGDQLVSVDIATAWDNS